MPSAAATPTLFPVYSRESLLAFQFSSWYPRFSAYTPKSTVIRPVPDAFVEYLHAEGVFVPEGADDVLVCLNFLGA
jgi:hypothetical protein